MNFGLKTPALAAAIVAVLSGTTGYCVLQTAPPPAPPAPPAPAPPIRLLPEAVIPFPLDDLDEPDDSG